MAEQRDDLDRYIAKRAKQDPAFLPALEAARRERRLLRALAEKRIALGLSQTIVARRMGTTQPTLARLERGEIDPRLSTLERYAEALGQCITVVSVTEAKYT